MIVVRPARFLALAFAVVLLAACGSSGPSASPSPSPSAAASSGPSAEPPGTPVPLPTSQLGNTTYGDTISGMTCDTVATHPGGVHAAVSITVTAGAKTYRVTPNLGTTDKCSYWLHADANGNLVFDAPVGTPIPTLNTLVTMWRLLAPTDANFGPFTIGVVKGQITVNGVPSTTNWQKVSLADGAKIEIVAAP